MGVTNATEIEERGTRARAKRKLCRSPDLHEQAGAERTRLVLSVAAIHDLHATYTASCIISEFMHVFDSCSLVKLSQLFGNSNAELFPPFGGAREDQHLSAGCLP